MILTNVVAFLFAIVKLTKALPTPFYPDHMDLEEISEIPFRGEKYRILRPSLHMVRDHFEATMLRRETSDIPSKRVFLDKDGFRHYWSGMENSRNIVEHSLRKTDIQGTINVNSGETNDEDASTSSTSSPASTGTTVLPTKVTQGSQVTTAVRETITVLSESPTVDADLTESSSKSEVTSTVSKATTGADITETKTENTLRSDENTETTEDKTKEKKKVSLNENSKVTSTVSKATIGATGVTKTDKILQSEANTETTEGKTTEQKKVSSNENSELTSTVSKSTTGTTVIDIEEPKTDRVLRSDTNTETIEGKKTTGQEKVSPDATTEITKITTTEQEKVPSNESTETAETTTREQPKRKKKTTTIPITETPINQLRAGKSRTVAKTTYFCPFFGVMTVQSYIDSDE